jgi:hypothetical protein
MKEEASTIGIDNNRPAPQSLQKRDASVLSSLINDSELPSFPLLIALSNNDRKDGHLNLVAVDTVLHDMSLECSLSLSMSEMASFN